MKSAIVALTILAALGAGATARADEVQDAVTALLEKGASALVRVEFDLQRIDGRGGQECRL